MLKNKIKAIKVGFLIVCILPTMSYALDKEDILKFLVKSSYPEVKVIDKSEKSETKEDKEQEVNKDNTDNKATTSEEKESDEEYVKIHVGEENIPDVDKEKETETEKMDTNYTNDLRVTNKKPQILIYHSHSSETYSDSPKNNYHSADKENSVLAVGDALTSELSDKGWGIVHSTTYNDLSYNESYKNSFNTAQSLLSQYDSVKVTIDLHRDGQKISNNATKKALHDKYTTEINGEKVAKFFLVVGQKNKNVATLRKEAEAITALAEEKYPGLVCPVVPKPYGRFNQYMTDNSLLIEIGSNATSTKEAKATTKYVAEILDEYYRNNK
ncbi:MAG: stage II sporulation protein P [Terrisporobacter sp.]|uniref:stage II sporulation protein P n=1 Tax=Terrisporobacter sp. TaxID=1965305 RepID=UPI002FC5FB19